MPLLGDRMVDRRAAEQQRAAHRDGEHDRRDGRGEQARGGAEVRGREEPADGRQSRERRTEQLGADAGRDRAEEADREHEHDRRHLRRRRGRVRRAGGRGDGEQRDRAGERRAGRRSTRPGPSSRGSTAASASATVGRTRAARRAGGHDGEQRHGDAAGDGRGRGHPVRGDGELGGTMPWRTSAWPSSTPSSAPGQMPAAEPIRPTIAASQRDHAADLTRRRGHRPQQRDLALALLDRQAHRAGHDEHRDEQRQPGERRGDRDQRGPRRVELGMLGAAARAAGEHLRAAGGGAQPRGVEAGAGEHADRVDAPGMAGEPRRLGVGQEDRRLRARRGAAGGRCRRR